MRPIKIEEWGTFPIGELFDIHPTKAYKLTNSSLMEEDGVNPVVVNSSFNNGIGGYTNQENTEKGGIITFSDTTSADAIFFQETNFVGYPHVQGMYPIGEHKDKWTKYSLLFFVSVFRNRALGLNYDYVNKFTRESAKQISIKLPVDEIGNPDFSYMETYMKNLELAVSSSLTDLQSAKKFGVSKMLDTSNWKNFKIEDLFEKLELKTLKKDFNKSFDVSEIQNDEFTLPLVNAKHFNNGIMYYGRECDFEGSEMTIDIVKNGAIATGDVYAQPQKTGVLWDAYLIKPKAEIRSELVLFFLATALEKAIKDKFSYDDKCIWQKVKKLSIPLPITPQNSPDYEYMEFYMTYILGNAKNVLTNLKTFNF